MHFLGIEILVRNIHKHHVLSEKIILSITGIFSVKGVSCIYIAEIFRVYKPLDIFNHERKDPVETGKSP